MSEKIIATLADQLKANLPGPEAQFKMSHASRPRKITIPENVKKAGVLALFYPKPDDWHLVLIERTSHNPHDRHKGQISFPGGRFEEADQNIANTALREAEEEIGVQASTVELLGNLTELYIPISNFKVDPYVGYLNYTPRFTPELSEVASIIEVPLSTLVDPAIVKSTTIKISTGQHISDVPYFDIYGKVVWGATAMMLSELLEIMRQ